ncbi:MAG: M16 family metallopeptidase [Terriglobales bacterium]
MWKFRVPLGLLALGLTLSPLGASAQTASQPGVMRARLANGLRVILVRNTLAPVATTIVNYRVGSNETPPGFPGLAHAQEHMMFRGSPGLSADQLNEISAAMGGDFNADTQQTVTQYYFTVPAADLNLALHIAAIRMSGVNDTAADWGHERGAIEQEVASDHSNPSYKFYLQLLSAMYKGTPLANSGLGTRPSFDKTTAAMLKRFHEQWYAPNNAVMIITGDFDLASTMAEVQRLFAPIPAKKLPPRPKIQLQPVTPATLRLSSDYPYGSAYLAFRMPGTSSPDFAAADILGDVLASQRGALYGLVPAGKALYATFELVPNAQASIGMAYAAYPGSAHGSPLVAAMRKIIAADVANGVSPSLVEAAKRDELLAAELNTNSIQGLADAWSQAVAIEGRHSPQDDIDAIERVTVAQVNAVARKYLDAQHSIAALLVPQPSGKPVSQSSFGGAESFTPKRVKAVPLPVWASASLFHLEVPQPTTHPVVTTLSNGLKLIVQPETVNNTVSVYGEIRTNSDLQSPPGQKGVAQLVEGMFSYGTTTLDRLAFQKALDDIGGNESGGASFSLQVLAPNFDRGLQLLADNEMHPAMPQRAFAVVREQTAGLAAGQLHSPGYLAGRALQLALVPASDPTLRQALPANIAKVTLPDAQTYYQRVYRPDLTTIVVIGNITPAAADAEVKKYFGSWTNQGPTPNVVLPTIPPNTTHASVVPDPSRVQDDVTLAETVDMNRHSRAYYAVQLGNYVLGGGLFASRLYRDLRVNAGLVYYVGSSFAAGRSRATYSVNFGCDPPKVAQARSIVLRDLTAMQTEPVTKFHLTEAKAVLLRQIPLGAASVDGIAGGWLARIAVGLPLDEPILAARAYLQLNAAQVQAAYRKWIRPSQLVQIVQGPAPQ